MRGAGEGHLGAARAAGYQEGMGKHIQYLELRCSNCGWSELCGPNTVASWLRKAGRLRAKHTPELDILYELFYAAAPGFACPECKAIGLAARPASENHAEWPGMRLCECCGKPIPRERLEALPQTTRCAACQSAGEQGRPPPRIERCPRCGSPLEVRAVESAGRTRYVMACSAYPPCRLD